MYKGYPFSRRTYYRRKKRAEELGCDIMDVPDGRGKHKKHLRGEKHYRWQTGKHISVDGYVKIRTGTTHPLACPNGYVYEHTLVWISAGLSVGKDEVLHHTNGDKQDNRLENLMTRNRGKHAIYDHGLDESRDAKGRFTSK